ncbi:MAG: FliM/FliN family flagellar motor switch protein [Planctomycetaceae bacterium]|nr:FliM/FliN family flagellar motor switch protein [Planctomycetaceae bacterium]
MSEFNISASDDFVKTMQGGFTEAAAAFARTFDTKIGISLGECGEFVPENIGDEFQGGGLLLLPSTSGKAAAILIPKSGGLIPDWCDTPDATGKSKLTTLAQEWGMSFFPDEFFPDEFQAAVVPRLLEAVTAGKIGGHPGCISLTLTKESGEICRALFVWPLEQPAAVLASAEYPKAASHAGTTVSPKAVSPITMGKTTGKPESRNQSVSETSIPKNENAETSFSSSGFYHSGVDEKQITIDDLPGFTRSVLKVRIPVAAVLAQAKRPIKMILELGIGSVIQFDKACDSFLDLQVGEVNIGTGEAVKVGDKFGLRVHSIQLPVERFRTVEVRKEGEFKRRKRVPAIIGKAPIRSLEPKNP